jgi:glutamate---cysteine ligase / carboxylate-amine ligase
VAAGADPNDPRFGDGEPFCLGVEEELFLADPETGEQRDAREQIVGGLGEGVRGRITGEVQACQVELITDVCRSASEAAEALGQLRRAVLATGLGLVGAGTHPSAPEGVCAVSDTERYRFISRLLGDARITPVGALHVHVGMPDGETAIRVFNGLREHLPLLEALGANAPYRHGRDSGFASARELALRAWPRSGAPRAFADYADFARYAERLTRAAGVPDYTMHWWKIRPHPRLGTVELRTIDAQSSLERAASLVALVHALARREAEADPRPPTPPELLEEASYRAAREGLEAELPDADGRPRPLADVLEATLAWAEPHAAALGASGELSRLDALVAEGGGAGVQRADHARGGIDAVLRGLLARTSG